jgi:TP53 regulating kinase and related kinases
MSSKNGQLDSFPTPSYPPHFPLSSNWELLSQGAEARLWKIPAYLPPDRTAVAKERMVKSYRHATLDDRLTRSRCKAEVKAILRARRGGVSCPAVWGLQIPIIFLEYMSGPTVRTFLIQQRQQNRNNPTSNDSLLSINHDADPNSQELTPVLLQLATDIGIILGKLHNTHTIHGDLTTSNMIYDLAESEKTTSNRLTLLDFGLARVSSNPEEMAVDLYVLERALISTHPELEDTPFLSEILKAYKATCQKSDAVLQRLSAVRLRGRKRECFG